MYKRVTLKILYTAALFAIPLFVFAQTGHTSSGLVPCGVVPSSNILGATACNLCDLAQLVQNIINFLIGVAIPISIALFAWAGIMYFTSGGNPTQITRAHKVFKSVLIGFAIALSAWLVVQTVLNALVNRSFFIGGSWNTLCTTSAAGLDAEREKTRNAPVSAIFSSLGVQTPGGVDVVKTPAAGGGGFGTTGGTIGTGVPQQISTVGPDGSPVAVTFQTDRDLSTTYDSVKSQYESDIQNACKDSTTPNCSGLVAAIMSQENGGKPSGTSPVGALGIMQLMPANGGANCNTGDTTCIDSQIQTAVNYLDKNCGSVVGTANCVAAYNGGNGTAPGSSPSGKNPAFATSSTDPTVGCSSSSGSQYAWQCATKPGGLVETQKYVANVCAVLKVKNVTSC